MGPLLAFIIAGLVSTSGATIHQPAPDAQAGPSWPDAPLTAGRWTYRPGAGGRSSATFGPSGILFQISCTDRGAIVLMLETAGDNVTIRTSGTERALTGRNVNGRLNVSLPANEPLLDAIAFSRGRFAVQAPGAQMVIPAWPELARVVEDCRR